MHHTKKPGGQAIDTESSRGASALTNAARAVLTLNRMTEGQARDLGVPAAERRRYVMVSDDKHNRAQARSARWYKLEPVELPNGDSVGAMSPWTAPPPVANYTMGQVAMVQQRMVEGEWRESPQADRWIGMLIGDVMGLDPTAAPAGDRKKIVALLGKWVAAGHLRIVDKQNERRKVVRFVEAGPLVEGDDATAEDPVKDFNPGAGGVEDDDWASRSKRRLT